MNSITHQPSNRKPVRELLSARLAEIQRRRREISRDLREPRCVLGDRYPQLVLESLALAELERVAVRQYAEESAA